ncbi:MAG: hypothetical protein PF542_01280 [Nanoarchaeota archaeon]|jgi:hypothetical protein|nr:hypothetical protein [Nanoarchaeota archaeon]
MYSENHIVKFENPLDESKNKYVEMYIYPNNNNSHYVRASFEKIEDLIKYTSKLNASILKPDSLSGGFAGYSFKKPLVDFIYFGISIPEGSETMKNKKSPCFYLVKELTDSEKEKFSLDFFESFKKNWEEKWK